jgi:DNA-binding NarL/FixJ family response regulator
MEQELKAVILDAATGEVIERPFTNKEAADFVASQDAFTAVEAAKATARESALAKLAALGLTEAEIAAL